MKKITKILSLTVVVASMMTPLALLANNSNSVNVKQEVNEVAGGSTGELNNANNDVVVDKQTINVNSTIDNDKAIGDIISSDNCTAEDSGQTTTTWMGIISEFINFTVSKDYVSESNVGEVEITGVSSRTVTSTYLKIPNFIILSGKKYTVYSIGWNAFNGCTGLIGTLTIPASVTTIGQNAFYDCKFTSVDISQNPLYVNADNLGTNCFGVLKKDLQTSFDFSKEANKQIVGGLIFGELEIPVNIILIINSLFTGCTGLTGPLTIPTSVTSIGSSAFAGCNFTSVSVETGNTEYCMATNLGANCQAVLDKATNGIFDSNSKTIGSLAIGELVLPSDITTIADAAFTGCSGLTGPLTIPTTVTSIGSYAFFNCTGLTGLDLSKATSLVTIGIRAFWDCTGLTGPLTIPASVTSIGGNAFDGRNFTSINVETGNAKYSMATNLGSNCYVVLDGTTNGIFDSNSKVIKELAIGNLIIPNNITFIGDSAFSNCTGLASLDLTKATSLTSIGNNAFADCTGLTGTLTIPASVTTIGYSAFFNCNNLTTLNLMQATNLTTIGDNAFAECTVLTGTLTIPASVTSIGDSAFYRCIFTSIEVNPLNQKYALASNQSVGSANVVIDKTIFPNLNYDYINSPVAYLACGTLTIPASVTTIGSPAFQYCTGLTGPLTIPTSVTSIGDNAFESCSGLESLDLSSAGNLKSIGGSAFWGCTGLTGTLTIPTTVTSIAGGAFYDIGSQDFKFLSQTPPAALGDSIFGWNVTKTLWGPSAQAKAAYDPLAVSNFGLLDASYIKFPGIAPTSVDITGVDGSYTINLNDTNKTIATAKADVQPNDAANKDVTWSLEDAPTWLKIDANGNITADDNLKNTTPGHFTFKVKAVCQADSTISNTTGDIELNVIQQENTDSFAWWWLLVAEAGALLLIGVISISVIVVKNKKNK